MRRLIAIALLLAAGALAQVRVPGPGGQIASGGGWAAYASLTTNYTLNGSATSANFPIEVYGSDPNLKSTANGGLYIQSSTCADCLFFTDAGAVTQVASEIKYYDPVNGIIWAFAQPFSTLSVSANQTFYIFVGNASPPSRTTGVWSSSYQGVWHFPNGTTLGLNDSSPNGFTCTNTNGATAAAGNIDGAVALAAVSSQYINCGTHAALNPTGAFTYSIWFKWSGAASANTWMSPMANGNSYGSNQNCVVLINSTGTSNAINVYTPGATLSYTPTLDTNWHYLVVTYDGTTMQLWVDASQKATSTAAQTFFTGNVTDFGIDGSFQQYPWDGLLSEARVATATRSASWITAEYNNQSSPGNIGAPGFLTWGSWL